MTNPMTDDELREEVRKLEEKFAATGKPVVVVYRAEFFAFAERLSKEDMLKLTEHQREYWGISNEPDKA
jgi:hypothetical protein